MTSTRRGRGSGSGGRMLTGEGVQPHVDVLRKLKSTDAKKLASV